MRLKFRLLLEQLASVFSWVIINRVLKGRGFLVIYAWLFLGPWVVKAGELFPSAVRIYPFDSEPGISLYLDFPLSLYLAYYSAVFFLIAHTIYLVRCPKVLSQYPDFGSVISRGHSLVSFLRLVTDFVDLETRKGERTLPQPEIPGYLRLLSLLRGEETAASTVSNSQGLEDSDSHALSHIIYREMEGFARLLLHERPNDLYMGDGEARRPVDRDYIFRELFWTFDDLQLNARRGSRMICAFFLVISLLMVAILSAQGFCVVTKSLVGI